MTTRLFHFSDSFDIDRFVPRKVQTPSKRADGWDWLNGPLVWAIDHWHQPMCLFPRDCPRILLWRTKQTEQVDAEKYFTGTKARMIAYVEKNWMSRVKSEVLCRYEFTPLLFKELGDAGMWVSDKVVVPTATTKIDNLPEKLIQENVDLRFLDTLAPLQDVWSSSLHVSGIRLRNASDWIH